VSVLSHLVPVAIFAAGTCISAHAETIQAFPTQPLQAVLDRAQNGDVIALAPGEYAGAIRIERRLVLSGQKGAVVLGPGAGSVITVTSPDVTIRDLTVKGSGRNLQTMDSGVFSRRPRNEP